LDWNGFQRAAVKIWLPFAIEVDWMRAPMGWEPTDVYLGDQVWGWRANILGGLSGM